jgi:hypothetical protein
MAIFKYFVYLPQKIGIGLNPPCTNFLTFLDPVGILNLILDKKLFIKKATIYKSVIMQSKKVDNALTFVFKQYIIF